MNIHLLPEVDLTKMIYPELKKLWWDVSGRINQLEECLKYSKEGTQHPAWVQAMRLLNDISDELDLRDARDTRETGSLP